VGEMAPVPHLENMSEQCCSLVYLEHELSMFSSNLAIGARAWNVPKETHLMAATRDLQLGFDHEGDAGEKPPTPFPSQTKEEMAYFSHCCYCELPDLISLRHRYPNDLLIDSPSAQAGSIL
jgi:hypothetical protein